ncbi:MAG: inositol monophosphatase family protein [Saprospiraceae bacterium]|nr:inositol monophosphatase [Saprospiraceae bacterium]MDW8230017.1 inositol monophosphatase family protein [Saprospiraceae bacterium]
MPQSELAQLNRHACQIVREVGAFLRQEAEQVKPQHIEEKHRSGLVTYVDRTAEQMLVERLRVLLPGASFYTEEETVDRAVHASLCWIIDPLDGTTNYLYGLPHYSISVGLRSGDELMLGIVYHAANDEMFCAVRHEGAWCNGQPIRVSERSTLAQALVATGFPYHNLSRMEPWIEVLRAVTTQARAVRRFGSAALDLAYVACGRFDVFYEYGLNAWDVAGGALLVHEAGGRISDFQGGNNFLNGGEVLACNARVFEPMLQLVSAAFYP